MSTGLDPLPGSLLVGEALAAEGEIFVLTDSLGWIGGEIPFRFTNLSDRTISLLNCNGGYPVWLERKAADRWVVGYAGVQQGCLSPPIAVAPGDELVDTLRVAAGHFGSNAHPQFRAGEIAGTYRLVVGGAYWQYDHEGPPWGVEVPRRLRTSDRFELRVE